MSIPKVSKQNIIDALEFIDENGIPALNESTRYVLVLENGKKYPPKYVVAVAIHLASGVDISTSGFDSQEARSYLKKLGFTINIKGQQSYELLIYADQIKSTDERFTMNDLGLGDNYEPLSVCFVRANGDIVRRDYRKGERKITNQTMPKIAFQLFEPQLSALSKEEKQNFPVCQYRQNSEMIRGIFGSVDEFEQYRKTIERMTYTDKQGHVLFVIYCWNIFSTIIFVQECLKRFGESGDHFVLKYQEKISDDKGLNEGDDATDNETFKPGNRYQNSYSSLLIDSRNLIFRGAPGTGKSHLAKEIAADIITNGHDCDFTHLTDEQKKQVEFVQFHPGYDYSDFVEGIRPKISGDGTMGFCLQDGIFKKFIKRARKNYEDSLKTIEVIEKENSVQESIEKFFSEVSFGIDVFETVNGSKFVITGVDEEHINIYIPGNEIVNRLSLSLEEIKEMLQSEVKFDKIKDVAAFFGKSYLKQGYSYNFAIYRAIKDKKLSVSKRGVDREGVKKYVFIIDEINRGEISKIFGELFFSIDPGYRGKSGEISTQYSNLHADPEEKFYIPENVYIIGTMNDIDRSVDSFDFAMRRRFRFVELKANESLGMLASLENEELEAEAIKRMTALNEEIASVEDLNENYQIGPAYFLRLKTLSFDQLWTDCLCPLLQEYVHGMYNEKVLMKQFAKAYGYQKSSSGVVDEVTQD